LGLWDALFFTYGLRAEWNPNYGKDKLPTTEPRFGVALTHDVGPVTAKVRASVGHSTRPPAIGQIRAISAGAYFAPYYPLPFDIQIGNRDLLPEQQQGWEGGIDVFLGSKISLTVTRYNQTVDDLIQLSQYADSVRGLHPISYYGLNPADFPQYPDGYAYQDQREWLNLGSIRNQGWTMQGTATLRAFTTQLTFSNTKSRIIGITPKFRREFSYYVVGSSFDGLAEHTWGVVETYARGGTMMSLAVNGVGQIGGGDKFQKEIGGYGTIRLSVNNRVRMSVPQLYHGLYHPYATAYLNVHQRLSSHVDGIVQLNNLLNAFRNDIDAFSANIGRQTSLGLQIRL
jgi:hypothetical protein